MVVKKFPDREKYRGVPATLDVKVVLLLVTIILMGPYLPPFGPLEGRIRIDHLLVPALTVLLFFRALLVGRFIFPPYFFLHSVFIAWLLVITISNPIHPSNSLKPSSFTSIIAGIDAYSRPLFFLFIAHNIHFDRDDLFSLLRLVLILGFCVHIIGILQLSSFSASYINPIIFSWYDNGRSGKLLLYLLMGGRSMSVFAQVGTFAMYSLICLSLVISQWLGARIVKSSFFLWTAFSLSFVGGFVSGSKVFTGGIIILFLLVLFFTRFFRRIMRPSVLFPLFLLSLFLILLLSFFLPHQFEVFLKKILNFSEFYDNYLASRFGDAGDHSKGKIFRTGAIALFKDNPLTGVGFNGVAYTTDSLWVGLLGMGGIIGLLIYFSFLFSISNKLYIIAKKHSDLTVSLVARMMLFLGIIFFFVSLGFHAFIQDRSGDIYWLIVGLLVSSFSGEKKEIACSECRNE
jgi:hypothetical protein